MAVNAEELNALNAAAQRLVTMLSPGTAERDVLQQCTELLADLIGARYAAIGLVDQSGLLTDFLYTGFEPALAAAIGRLPTGHGLLAAVGCKGESLRLDQLTADPRFTGFPEGHPYMEGLLALPAMHRGRVFGCVYLCDKRDGHAFTDRDEHLAGQFAMTLGLVLGHQRLSGRSQEHDGLAAAFAATLTGLSGEALLQAVTGALVEHLDVDLAFVGEIAAHDSGTVAMRACCDRKGPCEPKAYRLAGSPCQDVVKSKRYCAVAAGVAERFPEDGALAQMGAQSYAGVPLTDSAGDVIGLMAVIAQRPLNDDALPRWLLGLLADRMAAELELQRAGAALDQHSESLRALTESVEERFEIVTRIAPVGIFRTDAAGRCVYTNARWREISGLDTELARGDGWTATIHPEDREAVLARWHASVSAAEPFHMEFRFVHPDGSVRWVYGQAATERGARGTAGYVGTITDITELRRAEERVALQASLLDQVHSAVIATDTQMRIVYWNRHAETLYQWRTEEVTGKPIYEVTVPQISHSRAEAILGEVADAGHWEGEYDVRRKDGSSFPAQVALTALRSPSGELQGYVGVSIDVSERRAEQAERIKLSRAIEQTTDSVIVTDAKGVIEYVNRAFEMVTEYTRSEALGATPRLIKSGGHDRAFYRRMWKCISKGDAFVDTLINRKKNGEIYYEEKSITPLTDEAGRITHFVSTGRDISERIRAERTLSHLAYYDSLTDLPNRRLLSDRLRQGMIEARRHGRLLAVIFLDLDRFKDINDTLGHDAGDALLKAVGQRLTETLREDDTVARMSGDEFVLLLADVASTDDVTAVTRKIQGCFDIPMSFAGHELFVTPSMGVTIYPQDESSPEDLLKHADAAMYHAKARGRGSFHFYSEELNRRAAQRVDLENAMRHALENGEFRIHYQAQVDSKSREIVGMEALARWERPGIGLVSPADFIPLAEETGFIIPLGEWILKTACIQMRQWHRAGHENLRLAVNISARQLQHPEFAQSVEATLNETGLEATHLDLELTESLLMENMSEAAEVLSRLHALGVKFCLDDFGTGYSSLSYLKRFPIAFIKIDRSFVRDILVDPNDRAIVEAVVAMAQRLGIELIAEGIETAEQFQFFQALNCQFVQGFYCSRPLPAAEVETILRDGLPYHSS